MHFCYKSDQGIAKNLENKQKTIFTTENVELTLHMLPGSKSGCNSYVFLLKIDQGNARNLQNKPKKITTDNGELTLHMVPGSKSGQF